MPYSFRFRLIPLLVTIALCVVGVSLGQWQTRRALEKEQIAIMMSQRSQMTALTSGQLTAPGEELAFHRISLQGQFVVGLPLYLDNRPLHGVAGFYVLMPFKIHGSDQNLLVARGWQPRNPLTRTQMPELNTPGGTILLEGIARMNVDRVMQLGGAEKIIPNAILQNVNVADVSRQTGLKLLSFVMEQTSASSDGLQRDWPMPSAGSDKHRAYAFQWYALSLMAVIFFVVTGFSRGKNR
ncbi:SURF1 family protein [soil metagenome]